MAAVTTPGSVLHLLCVKDMTPGLLAFEKARAAALQEVAADAY